MSKVGIREVAEIAGVSPSTVSRVLNTDKYVSEKTRKKVLQAIKESKYRPNMVARGLRVKRLNSIGLIVPDIANEFFAKLSKSIEDVLNESNYNLFLCNSGEDRQKERRYIKALLDKFVDGIIFISGGFDENMDLFSDQMPIVAIDRKPKMDNVSFISSENERGGYLATRHLIENGCKRILMFRDKKEVSPTNARLRGYMKALEDYHIEYDPGLVVRVEVSREAVAECLPRLIHQIQFDGVFAGTDLLAIGAVKALLKLGYGVPKDIQVVGFDNITEGEFYNPGITTIAQEIEEMGRESARLILDLIRGKQTGPVHKELPVSLVKRNSTR